MTTSITFDPDPMLIDAALAGRLTARQLPPHELAWLTTQLMNQGDTIELAANRLKCSTRWLKQIRADHPTPPPTVRPQPTPPPQPDTHELNRLRAANNTLYTQLARTRTALDQALNNQTPVTWWCYRRRTTPHQATTAGQQTLW